ncbi:MAG: alpha/beta fold hydrolase [Actinobacteria bacterium]|nr:alpha/beta fold hydrolase [Actinomycetota bacterium]
MRRGCRRSETNERRPRRGFRARAVAAALVPVATLSVLAWSTQANAAVKVGGLGDALWAYAFTPKQVPGANDWNCKPSAARPRPVVLVHGTFENMGFNWAAISPTLKNAGYCVYALNYGANLLSFDQRASGLDDIAKSAAQLGTFVDKVRSSTGAPQVDLVGHSQGGMMPNYYIKRLGGASKVRMLVGLSPSNHGTDLSGLVTMGEQLGIMTGLNLFGTFTAPALVQQERNGPFQTALFADGDTVPGPKYVVIQTTKDEVVTPYTNAFLSGPNVQNITIQNQCPNDNVGHIGIVFDGPAIQNVLNALGPNTPGFKATCTNYGLGV